MTEIEKVSDFSTRISSVRQARWAAQSRKRARPDQGAEKHLGDLPLAALEDADEITRFKTDSEWAEDVELSSVHRVLERLRAAMNWGMAQTPPLLKKAPFHRFGVRMNTWSPTPSYSGAPTAPHQPTIETAWETLKLLANGMEPKAGLFQRDLKISEKWLLGLDSPLLVQREAVRGVAAGQAGELSSERSDVFPDLGTPRPR